jgi:hypothetical protein
MKYGQYLIDSLNVLNLCLFAAAGVFFFYFLYPLLNVPLSVNVPLPKEISSGATASAADPEKQAPADYAVIEAQNLFHPNRIIPPEKTAALQVPRPELVLHGTMITGGLKIAFVQDKKAAPTSPGRGIRQVALKEGETISGYKLTQVTDKMIVLASGEDQMTLYLDELKERKSEITGTGKAPAAGQAPPATQRTPAGQPALQTPSTPPRGPVVRPSSAAPAMPQQRVLPSAQTSQPATATPMPSPPVMRRP